jgi:hypothetical protein
MTFLIVPHKLLHRFCCDLILCGAGLAQLYGDGLRAGWPGFKSCLGQDFSLFHCLQTDSGAHPASYPVGARGDFPRGKVAGS